MKEGELNPIVKKHRDKMKKKAAILAKRRE